MRKGIRIEKECNEVKRVYIGKVYGDGSYGEFIKLYNDEIGFFQMQFLKGSDLAYTFLPKCTELLEILEQGIVGVSLETIAEELLKNGYEEQ
jgi:hypothetical protein